jgi:hypothetical protein
MQVAPTLAAVIRLSRQPRLSAWSRPEAECGDLDLSSCDPPRRPDLEHVRQQRADESNVRVFSNRTPLALRAEAARRPPKQKSRAEALLKRNQSHPTEFA